MGKFKEFTYGKHFVYIEIWLEVWTLGRTPGKGFNAIVRTPVSNSE